MKKLLMGSSQEAEEVLVFVVIYFIIFIHWDHASMGQSQKFKILSNSNFAPKSPRARVRCAFFLKKKTADFCDIDRAPRKRSRVHGMWNHKVCYYNRAKGNIIINVVEPGYRKLFVLHIIKLWGQKGPIPQFTLYFVLPGK